MPIEKIYRVLPVIVLGECFEKGVIAENIRRFEGVVEYECSVAGVGVGGRDADELDGDDVWVDGGDWVGEELGLDLVKVAHFKLGGTS